MLFTFKYLWDFSISGRDVSNFSLPLPSFHQNLRLLSDTWSYFGFRGAAWCHRKPGSLKCDGLGLVILFSYSLTSLMEKAMAPHSSTLAWKVPWTEGPGGLQSMGFRRVGHDWTTSLSLFSFMHWRRKWQPTPVFLLGESQGWGSLVGCRLGVAQNQTWLKRLSSSSSNLSDP